MPTNTGLPNWPGDLNTLLYGIKNRESLKPNLKMIVPPGLEPKSVPASQWNPFTMSGGMELPRPDLRPDSTLTTPSLLRNTMQGEFQGPPKPVESVVANSSNIMGMSPDAFASITARLAGAFAPYRLDRWGKPIPSWQGELSKTFADMMAARQMATAINSGQGAAGINPMLLALLLGGR